MTYPVHAAETAPAVAATADPGRTVVCSACGCRLHHAEDLAGWTHFAPVSGRDARGCQVACADQVHDARGISL
ncbi:MAG: hypothetical protein WCK58_11320 [Chloroflexota bacterium]